MSASPLRQEVWPSATCRLVERLRDPACYPHPTGPIRVVETHISWVLLTGPFVYKLKKPRDLGFLDYTTLEKRRHFCEEEIRVSSRFAPELYLAAVPITGSVDEPRVAGDGPVIEWAVKLVQFAESERLDVRFAAGQITVADCEQLASEIAGLESGLAVASPDEPWGTAESVRTAVAINLAQLRSGRPERADQVDRIATWLDQRLGGLEEVIARRRAGGRVRECHGDLHLGNLVVHGGRMTPFDAIEFSPSLRWIDVANDVAFLVMDLEARGRADLAAHVRSAWMEAADDHAAAAVLTVYEVYRAVVRAAVAALREHTDADAHAQTDRYLDLAERLMRPPRPILLATCGVSGSGKSTLAARLVGELEAVRLRSDFERKRLAGLRPTDRPADATAEAALYGEAMTRRVYERLGKRAATVLAGGRSVILDAAFNQRWQRELIAGVAHRQGVSLTWLELDLPEETVLDRVAARQAVGSDASDASQAVVRRQLAHREPITSAEMAAHEGSVAWVRLTEADLRDPQLMKRLGSV
jgi:aminoglycoside phosphotransferase family enzyme/predicted kinase